jgi:hypothetical protein
MAARLLARVIFFIAFSLVLKVLFPHHQSLSD